MPHADFVHLHCHTQFSLLDASSKIDELIHRAVELKFPALAMTDHGNLFGAIEFYSEAMKQGIKPILGMEAYIAPGSRFEKQAHGKALIEKALEEIFQQPCGVKCVLSPQKARRKAVEKDPLIKEIIKEFRGEIRD